MLGWDLNELFEKTLEAMRSCEADVQKAMEYPFELSQKKIPTARKGLRG